MGAALGSHDSEELPMQTISTIGLDIAKSVFQVHGVDAAGQVAVRRQLKRRSRFALFGISSNHGTTAKLARSGEFHRTRLVFLHGSLRG